MSFKVSIFSLCPECGREKDLLSLKAGDRYMVCAAAERIMSQLRDPTVCIDCHFRGRSKTPQEDTCITMSFERFEEIRHSNTVAHP